MHERELGPWALNACLATPTLPQRSAATAHLCTKPPCWLLLASFVHVAAHSAACALSNCCAVSCETVRFNSAGKNAGHGSCRS